MRVQEIGLLKLLLSKGLLVLFGFAVGATHVTHANSGGGSKYRLDLNFGSSMQNFSGISGAVFNNITRLAYAGAFYYRFRPWWDNGLQYSLIPGIRMSPVVFSDNIVGQYNIRFHQYEYLTGIIRKKTRVHFLIGFEYFQIKGTPELIRARQFKRYVGTQISYDAYAARKVRIPVIVRVLKKGRRLYEFTNKPDDAFDVKEGYEFTIASGLNIVF